MLAALMIVTSLATAGDADAPITGYAGLYMGHSFFNPAVRELKLIVPGTTIAGHEQHTAGAGGVHGSPRNLWEHDERRTTAQRYLASMQIDLLVMTYYSPPTSRIEDYVRWFDYAIAQNPKITFMVTIPWGKKLHEVDDETLGKAKAGYEQLFNELIVPLRKKYPQNKIQYCPYGLGTYELAGRLHAGKLPGVTHLSPIDNVKEDTATYLLNDALGHPSQLVARVGALVWLQTLYDYDLSTLEGVRLKTLPDVDVTDIAITVANEIKHYNAVYTQK